MKKSVYSIITIVLILYLVTGCERLDDFGDTNQDPSNSRNPETSALLTKVLSGLAEYSNSDFTVQGAIYCQYFAETFYVWTGLYEPYETSLMRFYSDDLYDLQTIIIANKDIAAKEVALINGKTRLQSHEFSKHIFIGLLLIAGVMSHIKMHSKEILMLVTIHRNIYIKTY